MGQSGNGSSQAKSGCTECQRRKQKCNREWPCDRCQKRKVADKCRFGTLHPKPLPQAPMPETAQKRQLSRQNSSESLGADSWDDNEADFEALGYTPLHLVENKLARNSPSDSKGSKQYFKEASSCPQLKHALEVLPSRPYTDHLVQSFLSSVNYHNYIIYPPLFVEYYQAWWSRRSQNLSLGLQWTCLLLVVCSCSAQYAGEEMRRKLEYDLGQPAQRISDQLHEAARELHSVVPMRSIHILNVQFLLHSCYCYRSEGRFIESWHVLNKAVREAQELGIAKENTSGSMSEFDREMRRRIWCILDTWDWQISSLLSRQMLIDRTECDPLERYSPPPLLHTKLQSQIIGKLFKQFKLPKNVVDHAKIRLYQAQIRSWMDDFPKCFDMRNPDKIYDASHPWVPLHRHYLRTAAYSMALEPARSCLARPLLPNCAPDEEQTRHDSVNYALSLVMSLHDFLDYLYSHDLKIHFVLFGIFDAAAVLCSAVLHDEYGIMSRRAEVIGAIEKALITLRRSTELTKTARLSYEVLAKVAQPIFQPTAKPGGAVKKKTAVGEAPKRVTAPASAPTPPNNAHTVPLAAKDAYHQEQLSVSYATPPSESPVHHYAMPHSSPSSKGGDEQAMHHGPLETARHGSGAVAGETAVSGLPLPARSFQSMGGMSSIIHASMTPPTDECYVSMAGYHAFAPQDLAELAPMWDYQSLNLGFFNPNTRR